MIHTIRGKAAAAVAVFVSVFVAGASGTVFGQQPPPVQYEADTVSTVVIAAPIVTIIVSLLIPLINGLLTKPSTPISVKAVGTIVLNAVWALFANGVLADGSATFSTATLYTAILGSVISIAMYAGVYKPVDAHSNAGGKLAGVGRHD